LKEIIMGKKPDGKKINKGKEENKEKIKEERAKGSRSGRG
jgi:hypothetical protein